MATLQETVKAVLAELQKQGTNIQDTSIADNENDFDLLLGFKDGVFVRIPTSLMPNDLSEEDKANLDRSFCNVFKETQDNYIGFRFLANRTDGVEVIIPSATIERAGVMSAEDKRRLNDMEKSFESNILSIDINNVSGEIIAITGEESVYTDIRVDNTTGKIETLINY